MIQQLQRIDEKENFSAKNRQNKENVNGRAIEAVTLVTISNNVPKLRKSGLPTFNWVY
uniref:Uncharacterized protein n=1 Tax=Arion vulgaris TaxID=1028688 RepID=A0A0B6ZD59_9EUPU